MSTLTSRFNESASRVAEQMDDFGREAAGTLHAAASSIRKGSKAIDQFAENTATRLDGAGTYVEMHNLKRTMRKSGRLVRKYAVRSIVLAAAVGVLTSLALLRLTQSAVSSRADVCEK